MRRSAVIVITGDNGTRVGSVSRCLPAIPRDLLDEGVDLLLTRDPRGARLRRHAAAVSVGAAGVAANPRAPHTRARAHVAARCPRRRGRRLPTMRFEEKRAGAMGPFWWQTLPDCEVAAAQPRDQTPRRRRESSTTRATARRAIWPSASSASSAPPGPAQPRFSTRSFRTVRAGPTSAPPG